MISARNFYIEWKLKGTKARFFMFLGALFLILALIGVAIPIIPQVPFAIISAFFFSKGSPRIHIWMRTNKYFGKPVRDWEDHRVIRPKMKIIASFSMVMGAIIAHWKLDAPYPLILDTIFAASIIFVLTRKSRVFSFLNKVF
jgi:uncharacterized membrane protein YbaN (DUF454 family)